LLVGTTQLFAQGRVVEESFYSPALENNLVGDSADRKVFIYLPPSYDAQLTKRYPTLYLFHGGGISSKMWISGSSYISPHYIPKVMDEGIEASSLREMIIVMPDAYPYVLNGGDGSALSLWVAWYNNTSVLGNYDDYLSNDLVQYIDNTYRTLPQPESRGISGHSMGGYGAIYLAFKHPDIYSVVYGQDATGPDFTILFEQTFNEGPLRKGNEIAKADDQSALESVGFLDQFFFSAGMAFSPNPDNPPIYVDWPWGEDDDGSLVRDGEIWQRWLQYEPVSMVRSFPEQISQLRAIRFDAGDSQVVGDVNNREARALVEALTAAGIEHSYEEFSGTHTNRTGKRLREYVLPFFSEMLEFEPVSTSVSERSWGKFKVDYSLED